MRDILGLVLLFVIYAVAVQCTVSKQKKTQNSLHVLNDVTTWLEGFKNCERDENESNGAYRLLNKRAYIADLVDSHGPLWTYGMEVVANDRGRTEVYRVYKRRSHAHSHVACRGIFDHNHMDVCYGRGKTYTEAEKFCRDPNLSLISIHHKNITHYNLLLNTPYWIQPIQEQLFLEASDLQVRCFTYDVDRILKTDICNAKHKTLCVTEKGFHVLEYVGNVTLPMLQQKKSSTITTTTTTTTTQSILTTNSHVTEYDSSLSSSSSNSNTPSSNSENEDCDSINTTLVIGYSVGATSGCFILVLLSLFLVWRFCFKREVAGSQAVSSSREAQDQNAISSLQCAEGSPVLAIESHVYNNVSESKYEELGMENRNVSNYSDLADLTLDRLRTKDEYENMKI